MLEEDLQKLVLEIQSRRCEGQGVEVKKARHVKSDRRIIEEADISLWNRERMAEYVRLIKQDRPNLCGTVADADIPEKMGLVRGGHPSITGLMVFSTCPQVYLPQLCITAIVVPGMEKGGVDVDGVRFVNNRKIMGAIPEMLDEAERFVLQNTKTAVSFDKDGRRTDRTEYPMRAVREAILNALIHRDYSEYSETSPIRLEIYSDRLEIANKGDIYGAVPVSALGHVEIGRRNALLRTDPQNPKSPFQRFVRARDNSCAEQEMRDAD